jgi:hypothetical protein
MNNDSYDLLTEVHKIKTKPIIDVVYQWVEGHQVERYGNHHLDKYVLLNEEEMYKLAKQYWDKTKDMNSPPQQIISDRERSFVPIRRHLRRRQMQWDTTDSFSVDKSLSTPRQLPTLGRTSCTDRGND